MKEAICGKAIPFDENLEKPRVAFRCSTTQNAFLRDANHPIFKIIPFIDNSTQCCLEATSKLWAHSKRGLDRGENH